MGREPSRDLRLPDGAGASDGGQPAFWYASMTSAGMRPRSETVYPLARAHSRIVAASPRRRGRPGARPAACLLCLEPVGGNATAVGAGVPVGARPLADLRRLAAAPGAARGGARTAAAAGSPAPTDPAGVADPRGQGVTQLG